MMGDVHSMDGVNGNERAREEWHWVVFVEGPLVLRSLGWGKGREGGRHTWAVGPASGVLCSVYRVVVTCETLDGMRGRSKTFFVLENKNGVLEG